MRIRKSSGEYQPFQPQKFIRSLRRSGVQTATAQKLAQEVSQKPALHSTQAVHVYTRQRLADLNAKQAMRYGLKRAIMDLGPTGFPFERYVAGLLQLYGYKTEVGQYVRGYCVSHEVDILAHKDGQLHLFECKYHNHRGMKTDVKVALYVKARFDDIGKAYRSRSQDARLAPKKKVHQAWLVTNTKCTTEAAKYAACSGINILSWGYPSGQSLERMIEQKRYYPVTVLLGLERGMKERLLRYGLVTIHDLLSFQDWPSVTGDEQQIRKLQQQARIL